MSEVEKHNNRDDLWVVINGKVYDLTRVGFLAMILALHREADSASLASSLKTIRGELPLSTKPPVKMPRTSTTPFTPLGPSRMASTRTP
jgi:hypothetical protein